MTPTLPFPLDQSAFRQWLTNHSTDNVGECSSLSHCPLANYIRHLLPPGEYRVNVGQGRIASQHLGEDWKENTSPEWANTFISHVDSFGETHRLSSVMGADCIHILDDLNKGDLL